MTYFITHPAACCLYAKCYGWQETLAHFFVKTRRSSLAPLLPHHHTSSPNILSPCTKDQSLNSSQESSNSINTNDKNHMYRVSTPVVHVSNPDGLSERRHAKKLDLLPLIEYKLI